MNSLMISKNGVQIMEDTYAEWDGNYREEFNIFVSK